MLTAITPLHFAFITKYVAHFVAQSLLFPTVVITRFFLKCAIRSLFPNPVTYVGIKGLKNRYVGRIIGLILHTYPDPLQPRHRELERRVADIQEVQTLTNLTTHESAKPMT